MSASSPSGLFFLDTNIFVYSFDSSNPVKQQIAQRLIQEALTTQRGMISSQVVQEFLNLAQRKFLRPLTTEDAREYLHMVLTPLCQHFPLVSFYDLALLLKQESGFSFYDSLILSAAVELGCKTLLSEDMQTGRTLRGVQIVNPFGNMQ